MKSIELGYGENTLILYIWGDNGASAEGQDGTISELLAQNGIPTTTKQQIAALNALGGLDVLGSPKPTTCIMPAGPGRAVRLIRRPSSSPRISAAPAIRWPSAGPQRSSPTPRPARNSCTSMTWSPTIYDILGITPPRVVNGVPQDPFDGVSFASTFNDPKAEEVKHTQYFEVMGSRAIYHDGWIASAFGPRMPWVAGLPPGIKEWTPDKDKWELYDLNKDWSQANDLADKMPAKVAEMKDLFLIEFTKNKGLPIGGGLWIPVLHPELRLVPPIHIVDLPGRNHEDA